MHGLITINEPPNGMLSLQFPLQHLGCSGIGCCTALTGFILISFKSLSAMLATDH